MKDTAVKDKNFKLIRYSSLVKKNTSDEIKQITVYMKPNEKRLSLFTNLESKFGGRVEKIDVKLPDNAGEAVLKVDRIPLSKNFPIIGIIKEMIRTNDFK